MGVVLFPFSKIYFGVLFLTIKMESPVRVLYGTVSFSFHFFFFFFDFIFLS